MGQEFEALLQVGMTIILQKSRPYFNDPVVVYEPAMVGRRTEDTETRGLVPFWETTIHIKAFNSGFCNCHIIFPYNSTLLDMDRIVLHRRVACFTPNLSTIVGANVSKEAFSFILLSFGCGFMFATFLVVQISFFMTTSVMVC